MVEQNTASHQYGNFMGDQNGLKAIRIRQITVIIPSQIALFKSLDFMSLLFEGRINTFSPVSFLGRKKLSMEQIKNLKQIVSELE